MKKNKKMNNKNTQAAHDRTKCICENTLEARNLVRDVCKNVEETLQFYNNAAETYRLMEKTLMGIMSIPGLEYLQDTFLKDLGDLVERNGKELEEDIKRYNEHLFALCQ